MHKPFPNHNPNFTGFTMLVKLILISFIYINVNGAHLPNGKPYYDIEKANELYKEFLQTNGKSYNNEEEYLMRFKIFVENLQKINQFNQIHENSTFAVNFLHDLTPEERSSFFGFRPDLVDKSQAEPVDLTGFEEIPDTVDWRDKNAVTPVKDQNPCGSCWAFSAVAVIESRNAIKNKQLISLSEQQLMDCDKTETYGGCNGGGDPVLAFKYAAGAGGMMSEADYPYIGENESGQCSFDASKVAVKVSGGKLLDSPTEDDMAKYVANYGPISIGFYMSDQLSSYNGTEVMTPTDCGKRADHAVTIVGYGTQSGTPYWLIKNSWGTNWGDNGYFKMVRGKGLCHIADHVSIAELP